MQQTLVLTLIGDDRPGLVEQLSATISRHHGNWLESSMARLGGKFAGILQISVPSANAASLRAELDALSGLNLRLEAGSGEPPARRGHRLQLAVVGMDRVGIVAEISAVLARHALNVEALNTRTSSAAMSADPLFHAEAELLAPAELDIQVLQVELERLSNDLMVDIRLRPLEP